MVDFKSPLAGYENSQPLPDTINPDGKSLYNPPTHIKSAAYQDFPKPIDSSNNGFDFHIYYMQSIPTELKYARELHERIRREFPELRIYKFWEKPVDTRFEVQNNLPSSPSLQMPQILDTALDAVGHTPLIRLDKIAKLNGLKCNLPLWYLNSKLMTFVTVVGKVEYMSAGGSVKDRIAKAMVEAAEKEGKLIPGKSIVIEPTSGNTGIGLAMACAIKGYAVIITMPNKMSLEKEATLRALGAEVIRTPTEAAWDSPQSHIEVSWLNSLTIPGVAQKLQREITHGIILDQYRNVNNPLAHEYTTGPEIIEAVISTPSTPDRMSSGKVDVVVAGAGTGGTVTGISRAIKKTHNKNCHIVGVDPNGSILAFPDDLNKNEEGAPYVVEGIGYDFIPDVLARKEVDSWIKTSDEEAFAAVQMIMREEGLLVGGSSGSALSGALRWLHSDAGETIARTESANVVVLLPDGIRNYMSKSWFLKIALEAEPTPLANTISKLPIGTLIRHPKCIVIGASPEPIAAKNKYCSGRKWPTKDKIQIVESITQCYGRIGKNWIRGAGEKSLKDVIDSLNSAKITERRNALASLKRSFGRDDIVNNFSVDGTGCVDPKKWENLFERLFNAVKIERDAATKEKGKTGSTSAAALGRLEDLAGTIRWLIERSAHLYNTKVMRFVIGRLLKTIIFKKKLWSPVALHCVKALRTFANYTSHLEHLEDADWIRMVEIGFNCLLDDPIESKLKDDYDNQDGDDIDLFEDNMSGDDHVSTTSGKRSRGDSSATQTNRPFKRARSDPRQISVSREQVEFMSLISVLLRSPSSPILSSEHAYLPSSILTRLRRFLSKYSGDTSLIHDYVVALSTTLSHLSLNATAEVTKFALASWDSLLGLWGTKNKRIKEGLVSTFRVLTPFVTSENENFRVAGLALDRSDGLHRLLSVLDGEVDSRWGVDGLLLNCLRLETVQVSNQHTPAFVAKTFRYGWNFDASQALTWAVLELQADCISKPFPASASSDFDKKRFRRENPVVSLLTSIQHRSSSNIRSYHLQVLLFTIDRHWPVFHPELQNDIINILLQFVSIDDSTVQSWVFLCFASIATINGSPGVQEATWDSIWTNCIRRANVPPVSRAACHAAYAILTHTRAYTQKSQPSQIPLASSRILFEIETLTKELDVQGPPYPYDSVCTFLSSCLRVSNQDMHLYRMQLEEKVLTWLVDCWQVADFHSKSQSLHVIKDLLILLGGICGFSRAIDLGCRIPLPEGLIVDTLVDEARSKVIKDYILDAQLPQFEISSKNDGLLVQPLATESQKTLVQPRSRERRITTFLLKTLERLLSQWNDNLPRATAGSARHSLDMAITALCFESTLVINGMQSDRRLIQCACKVIGGITIVLPDSRWTVAERALISLGLGPLTLFENDYDEEIAWDALLPPDQGSGIKSQLLGQLSGTCNTYSNGSIRLPRLNLLKILWQNTDVQSTFQLVGAMMRKVLRVTLGFGQLASTAQTMEAPEQDFEPIRTSTEHSLTSTDNIITDPLSVSFIMDVCVSFLAVGPALQSASGELTRDKELIDDITKCAEMRPEAFLSVLPVLLDKCRRRFYYLDIKSLDGLLDEVERLLFLYPYSKSPRLQSAVIQLLEYTVETWASVKISMDDTLGKCRLLCHWLSKTVKDGNLRAWTVRDSFVRFIDHYLAQDPTQQAWGKPEDSLLPSILLPIMGKDDDIRVRFRVAVSSARLFAFARHTKPSQTTNEIYLNIMNNLTKDLENYEHMLTRVLSLGNTMIVASESRRGAYWHLLETCLYTQNYSAHVEAVLRGVSARLGLPEFNLLFENYASQLALSLLRVERDFLLFPPCLLGYHDRKECVSANFRSLAPVNIWQGGGAIFENHCKIVSIPVDDGFRECFGNVVGYQITDYIDGSSEEGGLMDMLKTIPLPSHDFDRCLTENIDGIISSILRSLGDQEVSDIVRALEKNDPDGGSVHVFRLLVRHRNNSVETHLPNLPAFPTETVLRALRWLCCQVPIVNEMAVTYHIIHQLLADVHRSPFVNEQFRLVNSLCLWIATHPKNFADTTLLYTLMHGTTSLLKQSDLSRSAQSILEWAFERYRENNQVHPRVPDVLLRVACIAYDFSSFSDPATSLLGNDLLDWIDSQALELRSPKDKLHEQVMTVLPAWPRQPSAHLSRHLQPISRKNISSILNDSRISSNKFRLVRRLRDHATMHKFNQDQLAKIGFWRLKECIPPSPKLQDVDVDAFANLLYLSKGQLESFRHDPSGSASVRSDYWRTLATPEGTIAQHGDLAQGPITLILLDMLQGESSSRSHSAYDTLRLVMAAHPPALKQPSEREKRPSESEKRLSESEVELKYLGTYQRSALSHTSCRLADLVTDRSYAESVNDFSRWVGDFTMLLSKVLSTSDNFYAQLLPILSLDTDFAEQVLPLLVQTVLFNEKSASESHETIAKAQNIISEFFTSVLSEELASIQCLRCVIAVVLHLRHFIQGQPSGKHGTTNDRSYDALAYNKWLNIDFCLLARRSISCGAYTTALLFLELAAEEQVVPSSTSNEIFYEIYRHIDEPDGFYGISDVDLYQNMIRRFHHEKQWDRAFKFHGAALEAGDTSGLSEEGLIQSFHSFGFDHLANDAFRAGSSSKGLKQKGLSHDISYKLAWRTESWDLPESMEHSTGASVYLALRAVHCERDENLIDQTIRQCLFGEMDRLRKLGSEDFREIRDVIQDLMCLHEIMKWRQKSVRASLEARDLRGGEWGEFTQLEDDFDLIDIETHCLVHLSKAARAVNENQIALNSIVRAVALEKPPGLDAFEEFANVLWGQKEDKVAVEYLGRLCTGNPSSCISGTFEDRRQALVLAKLGSWLSAARLKKPEDIQKDYFCSATAILDGITVSALESRNTHATVYHQFATFAEQRYYDIVKSPDTIRLKIYLDRKRREIETLQKRMAEQKNDTDLYQRTGHARDGALKVMMKDEESYERHSRALDGFLECAIDMYSRCLEISDEHDQDAPISLCSLWFANFDQNKPAFQAIVKEAIQRVPSRKFVFLSHQLSARILKTSTEPSISQTSLQTLVLRMCRDHPFHTLYQVYCLKAEEPARRRQSSQSALPVHAERAAAAADIYNRLRQDSDSKVRQRVMNVEQLSAACVQWAKHRIESKTKTFKLPPDFKLAQISNLRVPVMTHHTPIDPSMRYDDYPTISRFDVDWRNAGGKNAPKIGLCIGSDNCKYRQLFKGQGQDDLRQDAVMEQVFNLVNGILYRDKETRRRLLNVREYKVIPLAAQAGLLEFVGNTQAMRDWLVRAHKRYHPAEKTSSQLSSDIYKIRTAEKNPRPAQVRLLENWTKIEQTVKPVMRHFFTEKHKTPNSWFATRLDYSRSVATSSIVGHILGLGDRHISNILLDNETGEVVPIDLGIAFDQGKLLGVPELVPFRLTRDIVDGMGMSGTAGVFQRCAEETLRVLRDASDVIMTVLEVFKHDPLHSWTASETKIQHAQEGATTTNTVRVGGDIGIDMTSGSAEEAADRALSSVSRKLDKSLSVQTVVSQLIREATDRVNLALMFEGECFHFAEQEFVYRRWSAYY
ncbi:hypothetical protein H0H93_010169 [Arthromyces matolae]|nr:hypothetical protein H0H93_010169 [Arthromyces matolae]